MTTAGRERQLRRPEEVLKKHRRQARRLDDSWQVGGGRAAFDLAWALDFSVTLSHAERASPEVAVARAAGDALRRTRPTSHNRGQEGREDVQVPPGWTKEICAALRRDVDGACR